MKNNKRTIYLILLAALFLVLIELAIRHLLLANSHWSQPLLGRTSPNEVFMGLVLFLLFSIFGLSIAKLLLKGQKDELFFQQELIDNIPVPIFYKDKELRYLGCNTRFETLIGRPLEEIVGKTVQQISPGNLAKEHQEKDLELMSQAVDQIYESEISNINGEEKHVIFHKSKFNDIHGTELGIVGVILDITELKAARAENEEKIKTLEEAMDELKKLSGLLPICMECKNIRDDKGYWNSIEAYISHHSEAKFSHGICPRCMEALYGDKDWYNKPTDS